MGSPEMESVEAFVEYLLADERNSFTYEEAVELATALGVHEFVTIRSLKDYGLAYEGRQVPKQVRGFHANNHDRWSGPGSSATHGGSGWEQISGFAGQKG